MTFDKLTTIYEELIMKKCSKCKQIKELTEFSKQKNKKDGYRYHCNDCIRIYAQTRKEIVKQKRKQRQLDNPDEFNKKQKEIGQKYYSNNVEIIKEKGKKRYNKNMESSEFKDKKNKKGAEFREKNKEEIRRKYEERMKDPEYILDCKEKKKIYYENNKEEIKENARLYLKNNKAKSNANGAKKKAAKIQATPKWLTKEHLQEIENFYIKAKEMEKETGKKYHVDHIVPLQGKTVCGLHVPWNLQILEASENISKGNRF
jgi:hypothetical protein